MKNHVVHSCRKSFVSSSSLLASLLVLLLTFLDTAVVLVFAVITTNSESSLLFPPNDEYDAMILNPNTIYGSPIGGYSRATASRLASIPLTLPSYISDATSNEYLNHDDDDFAPSAATTTNDDNEEGDDGDDNEKEVDDENENEQDHESFGYYYTTRDQFGRQLNCRVYLQDELTKKSLEESFLDLPIEISEEDVVKKNNNAHKDDNNEYGRMHSIGEDIDGHDKSSSTSQQKQELARKGDHSTKTASTAAGTHTLIDKYDIDQRLSPLEGMCAQYHQGWWSYEWCYKKKVMQFHVHTNNVMGNSNDFEIQDVTNLGNYYGREVIFPNEFNNNKDNTDSTTTSTTFAASKQRRLINFDKLREENTEIARVTDTFKNGNICPDTGKPRVSEVALGCCSSKIINQKRGGVLYNGKPHATDLLALTYVSESKEQVCHYEITVCTPLLCTQNNDADDNKDQETSSLSSSSTAKEAEALSSSSTTSSKGTKSIRKILEESFGLDGKNNHHGGRHVTKKCIQTMSGGWWLYELCPGRYLRQFHEVAMMDRVTGTASTKTEAEYILGRYDAKQLDNIPDYKSVVNATDSNIFSTVGGGKRRQKTNKSSGGNGAYFFQEYTGGEVCDHVDVKGSAIKAGKVDTAESDGSIVRSATIKYSCGTKMELTVKEDATCHYVVDVVVPALCDHPLFKPPVYKKQVIKCTPSH